MALTQIQVAAIRHLTPDSTDRAMTNEAFCALHSISLKTLEAWQAGDRCPEFKVALLKSKEQAKNNPTYFLEIARHAAVEAMIAGLDSDDAVHQRSCMKMLLQETKDLRDTGQTVNYDNYSEPELEEMAKGRNLDVEAVVLLAAAERVKGAK
jgi:hypothetical protein